MSSAANQLDSKARSYLWRSSLWTSPVFIWPRGIRALQANEKLTCVLICSKMANQVLRFSQIAGLCGKRNDLLLFCKNKLSDIRRLAVFFHGDLQVRLRLRRLQIALR